MTALKIVGLAFAGIVGVAAIGSAFGSDDSGNPAATQSKAPKKDTNGCATAERAFQAYDESVQGAQDGTATPADQMKAMGTIKDKMESVSLIAAPELKASARAAAVSAGRIRVAFAGGDADVAAEAARLRTSMRAASTYCHE